MNRWLKHLTFEGTAGDLVDKYLKAAESQSERVQLAHQLELAEEVRQQIAGLETLRTVLVHELHHAEVGVRAIGRSLGVSQTKVRSDLANQLGDDFGPYYDDSDD